MEYEIGAANLYRLCCTHFELPTSATSLAALEKIDSQAAEQSAKRKTDAYKGYKVQLKRRKAEQLARKFMRAADYTYTSIDAYESDDDGLEDQRDSDSEIE